MRSVFGTLIITASILLLLAMPVAAQGPTPDPVEGTHGAVFVSYGYTEGSKASVDNLQFDLDLDRSRHRPLPDRTLHVERGACWTEGELSHWTDHAIRTPLVPCAG